jgi:hypothetical protein
MKKECVKKDPKFGAQSLTHFMNIKQRHPSPIVFVFQYNMRREGLILTLQFSEERI